MGLVGRVDKRKYHPQLVLEIYVGTLVDQPFCNIYRLDVPEQELGMVSSVLGLLHVDDKPSGNSLQVPYYHQETIEFEVQPTEIAFAVQNDTVNLKVNKLGLILYLL